MGAVADLVLAGVFCETCFGCIDGKASDAPRKCVCCMTRPPSVLKCSKCDKSFFSSDALKQHMKAKHG